MTTADVLGTVTDTSGAVVSNAKVTITNTATIGTRSTLTNSVGEYVFTFLIPGKYSVRVEAPSFKAFVSEVSVSAGDRARVDAQLEVGAIGETVEVQATTPLLQTDNSTISDTVTGRSVEDLPLGTRNLTNLVQLVPGANEASSISGLSSGQRPDDRRQTNSFSVHGHDDVLNNELIDGTDNNERIIGTIGVKPSIDAVQEVVVQTNEYLPETGRTPGGVVNIITKSGTNHFHGSLYEFFQNNALNARNPFNPKPSAANPLSPQSELRQNDFGGSIGGPIFRDRTFFFAAVEEFRQVAGVLNPIFSSVPTLAQRQAGPQAIVAADSSIQAGTPIDPIAAKLFTLYPLPNNGAPGATTNNFVFDPNKTQFGTTVDARVDHRFDDNNLLYGRYTLNHVTTVIPDSLPSLDVGGVSVSPGSGPFGFSGPAKDVAHNAQLNFTHSFSPALLLELKAAYTRIDNFSDIPNAGKNAGSIFGFPGNINFGPAATGLPLIEPSGLQALGDSQFIPLRALNNTFQYNGAVTYNIGAHTIKAGAALIRRQARSVQSANANGSYNFGVPEDAGNEPNILATFLVGAFTGVNRSTNLFAPDYRSWEPGFFVQDNWKARRWLTLNYGFRYDVYTPFTEAHNHISNFDLKTGQVLVAGVNGVSDTAGIETDYSNFGPRVGFAASVGHGTVVRGGFGLTFFAGNYTSNASLKNPPFTSSFAPNCASPIAVQLEQTAAKNGQILPSQLQRSCADPGINGPTSLEQGIPVPTAPGPETTGLNFSAVQPDLQSGSVYQFNLIVEKQFGQNVLSAGYIGDLGRHLPMTLNNVNVPNPTGLTPAQISQFTDKSKPFPNVGNIPFYLSEGSSSYHALQVSFQRRYSKGVTIGSNYTWSHSIDDTTILSFEGQEGWGNANPFNVHALETSNSDLDLRHRFVTFATYELPFGKNSSGISKALIGGWQTNMILAWNSGSPFTITDNASESQTVFPGSVGAAGPDRPLQIGSPSVRHQSIAQWFNPSAFVVPPPGVIGNTPRNSLYGPHFRHFDFSLFKDIPVRESVKLQLRSEFYNLTNTPSYFIANNQNADNTTNLVPKTGQAPDPAFGQIVRTNPNYTPRTIQLALKLLF